jgi:alpha-1,2-mannosyltransferase
VNHASTRSLSRTPARRSNGVWLLVAGALAFLAIMGSYLEYKVSHAYGVTMDPVDLHVYTIGGLILRHVRPWYNPHRTYPLYGWPGYTNLKLQFTYTPFAAEVFAVLSFIPWAWLPRLWVVANIVFLVAALWFTYGGLGYTKSWKIRAGATLLTSAAVFWTEPVIRTVYLGQINLALMALILWDMTQPDHRRLKGIGVGIAAGIKLVPLIFIPYLIVTRRFRQAIVAAGTFVATVAAGFVVAPDDSFKEWFTGYVWNGGNRAGFEAWEGNQSMRAIVARLMGSLAGSQDAWLLIDVLTVVAGLAIARMLDRKGHRMAGVLAAALTGLLASPISWDHHWVWSVPCVALVSHYAVQAMRARARGVPEPAAAAAGLAAYWRDWASRARLWATSWAGWGCWALAALILATYGAWPGFLFGHPRDAGQFSLGLIFLPPGTGMGTYEKFGDLPRYAEYHWHGVSLLVGNAFVLGGIGLLILGALLAWYAPYPASAAAAIRTVPGSGAAQAGPRAAAVPASPDVAPADVSDELDAADSDAGQPRPESATPATS